MNVPSSFVVVSFMVAMAKTPGRNDLRKKALFWLLVSKDPCPSWCRRLCGSTLVEQKAWLRLLVDGAEGVAVWLHVDGAEGVSGWFEGDGTVGWQLVQISTCRNQGK